jgi:hypothetical protein
MRSEKRGRGRPRSAVTATLGAQHEIDMANVAADHACRLPVTRRHELKIGYEQLAEDALEDEDGYDLGDLWCPGFPRLPMGRAVMAELGRHGSDEQIRASFGALRTARPRLRTQGDALRFLRKRRLGTQPRRDDQLGRILTRAINRYRARYPALTTDQILDTLEEIAMLIWAIRDEEIPK